MAGKRLLGYLPTVQVRTAFRGSVLVGRYRRLISRTAMQFVVQQILDLAPHFTYNFEIGVGSGKTSQVILNHVCHVLSGMRYNCHVRVPFFIADEMDLSKTITGMFASSASHRPCNMCDAVIKIDMRVLG